MATEERDYIDFIMNICYNKKYEEIIKFIN